MKTSKRAVFAGFGIFALFAASFAITCAVRPAEAGPLGRHVTDPLVLGAIKLRSAFFTFFDASGNTTLRIQETSTATDRSGSLEAVSPDGASIAKVDLFADDVDARAVLSAQEDANTASITLDAGSLLSTHVVPTGGVHEFYGGGMDLNDGGARPACDATTRGWTWIDEGGAGVADAVATCVKDAADAYAWTNPLAAGGDGNYTAYVTLQPMTEGFATGDSQGVMTAAPGAMGGASTSCNHYLWTVNGDYASGNPIVNFVYIAETAFANNDIVTEMRVYEIPRTSSAAVLGAAVYDGPNVTSSIACDAVGDYCSGIADITVSGLAIAAGDEFVIETCRHGADAADTHSASLGILTARLSYTANK